MVSEHSAAQVLVASNRGPISYTLKDDGSLDAKRGGGGLVSGLSAIGSEADALWVCAALGDGDREAVRRGEGADGVLMLDIDEAVHADAYNGIANSVLWFVHHMLYQTPLEPAFDAEFRRRWGRTRATTGPSPRRWPSTRARAPRCWCRTTTCAWCPACSAQCAPTCASVTSPTPRGRRWTTSGCCPTTSPNSCCGACSAPTAWGS